VTAVGAAFLLSSGTVRAHENHHRGHARSRAAFVAPAPVVRAPVVVVPRTIVVRDAWRYRAYRPRSAYYAPHRHVHVVYTFPVNTPYGIVYRPYAYCGDHLFVPPVAYGVAHPEGVSGSVQFVGPNFSVGIGF